MSQQNSAVVRRVFDAFNSEDVELVIALTHVDFELEVPPELSAEPDIYRGHDGMRRYWESFRDAMDEIRLHPEQLGSAGESVVVAMHLTAKGRSTGIAVEQRPIAVLTICDAKVIRIQTFTTPSLALEAAGLDG
jgi:ketosteroid isomerase-like protein